jgi:hypothetical protein
MFGMDAFPEFMKHPANRIAKSDQATPGVEGYVFDGAEGSQMAFWTCAETAKSKAHAHEFDEYMVVVQGCYTLIIDGNRIPVRAGLERYSSQRRGSRWNKNDTRIWRPSGRPRILKISFSLCSICRCLINGLLGNTRRRGCVSTTTRQTSKPLRERSIHRKHGARDNRKDAGASAMNRPDKIIIVDRFAPLQAHLLTLLAELSEDDWARPTAAPGWSVKDVASRRPN